MAKVWTIVGTGVSGTAALIALARQFSGRTSHAGDLPKIITIEKSLLNGPGYPYSPTGSHASHLLNHPATEMAMKPVDEAGKDKEADFEVAGWHSYDFVHWLEGQRTFLIEEYPESILASHPGKDITSWSPDPKGHYSRGLFGLYAQDRFREAAATLQKAGVEVVSNNRTEVVASNRRGGRLVLTLKNLDTDQLSEIVTDRLLLATGRWAKQVSSGLEAPYYFEQPYPARRLLDSIKPDELKDGRQKRVIVQGMGLSALDTILSLATGVFYRDHDGVLRYRPGKIHAQIIAVSRSGYFPIVRGMPAKLPQLKYFTPDNLAAVKQRNKGYLVLRELKTLFEHELKEHLGKEFDMKAYFLPNMSAREKLKSDFGKAKQGNIVYAVCRQILALQLFSQLSADDKEYFTKNLRTQFLQNVAAMPVINAEKMLALFDAGVLLTVGLGYKETAIKVEHDELQIDYTNARKKSCIAADCMVKAAGDELDITRNRDPLIRSLIESGEIVPSNAGGIKVDFNEYAVVRNSVQIDDDASIYALGMPVTNWAAERDFASASIKAAHAVAAQWVGGQQ